MLYLILIVKQYNIAYWKTRSLDRAIILYIHVISVVYLNNILISIIQGTN